jgi:beta-N-acetylhexosaminidase
MASLEDKIGQMLLLGFRGLQLETDDAIARDIRELKLGGVILFDQDVELGKLKRNIESPDQVRALTKSLQGWSEIPLLIAVDQEGGQVCRLREIHGFPSTLSAEELGCRDDLALTRRYAEESAQTLADVGFTLNFAPSVDLAVTPENPIIARKQRSFSRETDRVVRHAREVIMAHQSGGVGCVIKHFPGHGSSVADTHLGLADVTGTWSEEELEPFAQLIKTGHCWSVMTAHVFNEALDPEWPATLSHRVIGQILRERLGFTGVVFSDDMEMRAISALHGLETSLFRAIEAGVDVLVFANNAMYRPDIGRRAVAIIKKLIDDGAVAESRIDESFQRIMTLKHKIGSLP